MRVAWLTLLLLLPAPALADHVSSGLSWACGFGGSSREGHPDDCGIDPVGGNGVQSVGDPEWGDAWVDGDERIIGIVVTGEPRAVPVKLLDRHEIINDVIAGVPVAITYCPLCGSGVSFERNIDLGTGQQTLDFAPSGFLYQHDLVMWDAQNGILWNQILGRPIGTLRDGQADTDHLDGQLAYIPTEVATWHDWHKKHPDSLMLQPVPGYSYGGAYAGYDGSCQFGISGHRDCDVQGLHPKEVVLGIDGPRGSVAFPLFALTAAGAGFDAEAGVVATASPGGITQAYDAGRHTFSFEDGTWRGEDGHIWDLANGTRTDGVEGLVPLDGLTMYWFAWNDHHPETALWLPEDTEGALLLKDNGKLPGFTIGIVAIMLLAIAFLWRRR